MPAKHGHLTWWQGLVFILIAAVIVILDQISKEWIRTHIALGESLPEMGCLNIVHIQNTGSAFGLFTNQAFLLSIVAIAGLVIILIFFRYLSELGFAGGIALSLIFAGALGNQIDRFRLGHVTDFIYVRLWGNVFWPAFNVADSAITVGAISLGIIAMIGLKKTEKAEKATKAIEAAGKKDEAKSGT
jgi:signal peptidase II